MKGVVRRPLWWRETKEGREAIGRQIREYWREVHKSEGFDVSGIRPPHDDPRSLVETICDDDNCSRIVQLYARMGLHRYNLLQGKNLQLSSVKKYNKTSSYATNTYYITLEAMDPASHLLQTFQTRANELQHLKLVLSCGIARPLGETKRSEINRGCSHPTDYFFGRTIPEWPPENPFKNPNRCYVLKKSDLQENMDWIRLNLELAVGSNHKHSLTDHDVSNLKIVKVAIDTSTQDVEEGVFKRAKCFAIVYIRYKDSCEARVGKDVNRVAIVRRFFHERMQSFILTGQNMSSEMIPKIKGKKKQLLFTLRFKPWLLPCPRRSRHCGLVSSRCLHKTISSDEKTRLPEKGKKRSAQLSSSPRRLKAYKYSSLGLSPINH